jgi:hypothetical protein
MDAISTGALHAAIAAVCPIVGLSLGRLDDRSTWVIDFDPAATAPQRTAAQNIVATFTPTVPPLSDAIDALVLKVLFNHENRIRTLEGKAAISAAQFKTALVSVLGG